MQFIMNVRDNCNVSHAAIDRLIDGSTDLVDIYLTIILVSVVLCFY